MIETGMLGISLSNVNVQPLLLLEGRAQRIGFDDFSGPEIGVGRQLSYF